MDAVTDIEAAETSKRKGVNKLAFLGLFLPIAALVVLVGMSFASARTQAYIDEIIEHDGVQLQQVGGFLGTEVLASLKHLSSLSAEHITQQALDAPEPAAMRSLEWSFLILAQRNPLYQQVRWIDEAGMERARVTRNHGELIVAEPEELQDKSDRYYFQEANALLPGELYISRIDLNEEHGEIEMPPRPMLRVATPVSDSDRNRRGIMIINIDMKYLFEFVRTMEQADADAEYLLVNQEGVLLNADFAGVLSEDGEVPGVDFIALQPEVWEQVLRFDAGSLEKADGLWSWRKLSPVNTFKRLTRVFPEHLVAFDQMISDEFSLTMLAHRPIETMEDVRHENLLLMSLGITFVLSVFALTLFFYLSGTARARRAEVKAAHEMERAMNLERMKELEQRFHRLVEASSIGQLVVDSEGRIEISNHAAEDMLGYDKGELRGLSVDALLPASLQEQHAEHRTQYLQAPESKQMGFGRELQAVRKDGSTFPVEVGLNPYSDNGQPMVLASIIDLSHRPGYRPHTD